MSGDLAAVTPLDERLGVSRRVLADPTVLVGAGIVTLFLLVAALADVLAQVSGPNPYDYDLAVLSGTGAPAGRFGGISADHWFGVEPLTGRDLFAVVVYGARTSILVGVLATVVSVVLGIAVGLVSGYLGGRTDRLLSRVADVVLGFPGLIFMIALGAIIPAWLPKSTLIVVVIGFFGWPPIARVVRGQTLLIKNRNYVVASQAAGARAGHVILRQILPNLTATIIVFVTISIPGKIGTEAALSFLGVGVPPPTPAWGRSIGDAIGWVQTDPMFLVFPGAALFAVTLGFNLLGDGLRDALDPRSAGLRR